MHLDPTIDEIIFISNDDINRPLAHIEVFFDKSVHCFFIDAQIEENTHSMMQQINPELLDRYMMALHLRVDGFDELCEQTNNMIWANVIGKGMLTDDETYNWGYHALLHVIRSNDVEILDVDYDRRYVTVGAMFGDRWGGE